MITKNIKNIALTLAAGCGLATLTTSCSDFLDILPMNDVVLENYWTEKGDVISVRNSCYESLESADAMNRIGLWGELRSDNLFAGANVPNEVNEILKENLLPSNPYCNWSKIYECINRCNTVCHYAPEVQKIDPNYSEADMKADVAEVSALRALCYFYLIRTFRDVPYTREPSIDDTQNFILPATPFNAVLDSLIQNLESVKGDAVRRYQQERISGNYFTLPVENTSRITRIAIYALLADLYLWKQDYDNAIRYADMVIDYKTEQYEALKEAVGDIKEIQPIDSIPLILESPDGSGNVCGNTYNTNELTFTSLENVVTNKNQLYRSSDGRFYEFFRSSGSAVYVGKYVLSSVRYQTRNLTSEASLQLTTSTRGSNTAPWIFYRLTEMLLIKAEALVERGQPGDFEEAFKLVNIVNKRANNLTVTLKKEDYINSKNEMANLVLDERRREFMFEGKRWYDLVRRSRRDGNTAYLVSAVKSKYESKDANAISIKKADTNIIYFPYAKNELKVNPLLVQNSAFTNGEDSQYQR